LDLALNERAKRTFGPDEALQSYFSRRTLRALYDQHRNIIEGWVRFAAIQTPRWIDLCKWLLEPLCEVLLDAEPVLGVELARVFISREQQWASFLPMILLRAPEGKEVESVVRELLSTCHSDAALRSLGSAGAQNDERLEGLIRDAIASSLPLDQARALGLSGYAVHGTQSGGALESVRFHPGGWLHQVQEWARRNLERDRWAQEWFRRFLVSPNSEEAFGAFWLFLRCVDRRYWVWHDGVLDRYSPSPERLWFLRGNSEVMKKAIQENEKDSDKLFLGSEILKDAVFPWLERYLG
jgi:hypothetical protein